MQKDTGYEVRAGVAKTESINGFQVFANQIWSKRKWNDDISLLD